MPLSFWNAWAWAGFSQDLRAGLPYRIERGAGSQVPKLLMSISVWKATCTPSLNLDTASYGFASFCPLKRKGQDGDACISGPFC